MGDQQRLRVLEQVSVKAVARDAIWETNVMNASIQAQ
jgi:hypothetical protein